MKHLNHFRAHFLTFISLAYITGIAVSAWLSLTAESILAFSLLTFTITCAAWAKKRYGAASLFCILLFFYAGVYHENVTSRLPAENNHIYNLILEPTDTVITGHLTSMPAFDGTASKVYIKLHSVRLGASAKHIPTFGTVLLQMRFPWPEEFKPGTFLAIRTVLKHPGRYKTPGSFDYPKYLARKDIWMTGFIRSPTQIIALKGGSRNIDNLSALPEIVRTRIGAFLDGEFTKSHLNGLYRAILLGDRSRLSDEVYENFKASGLAHILAISGLHLSVIGAILFIGIHRILSLSAYLTLHFNTRKTAGLLTIPILIGYSFLAGLNNPVLRACIMSVIVLVALFTNRVQTLSILIAFAAMVLLIFDPQALFTASFQLSFAAITSIGLFIPVITTILVPTHCDQTVAKKSAGYLGIIKKWILSGLLTSSAAVLGTLPIILYHFNRFPLAGPPANLIVEPLICLWALPLGFLSLPFMHLSPDLAGLLLHLGGIGLTLSCHLTSFIQSIPFNSIWSSSPSWLLIILYYTSFIVAACSPRKKFPYQYSACIPFTITLALLLVPALRPSAEPPSHEVCVSFLDVGQGSATLLEFADGRSVLIDGGGSSFSKTSVGESVIAPFLWQKGIKRLDGIIVTHPDADHYNGLPFLIEHFSPRFLWTSTLTTEEPGYMKLLSLCVRKKMTIHEAAKGDMIRYGDSAIGCLANTISEDGFPHDTNAGLILQLVHKDLTILFPGDISGNTEEKLVLAGLPLQSDILLAPHHGSATSNSPSFLERISPKTIIVSSGASKGDHFPSRKLITYCKEQLLPLWKTAKHGTVTATYTNGRKQIILMEDWQRNRNPLRRNSRKMSPAQEIGGGIEIMQAAVTPR